MELAIDVEGGHVLLDVEGVGHIGGVEDEVEFECPVFGPVFLGGDDEFLCTHLLGILFFVGGVREGVDFGSECLGPEDTKVTETATVNHVSRSGLVK